MQPFVTLADLEARHPAELITLAADETTGLRDDERIEAAIGDASAQIRAILRARYSVDELSRLDADSRDTLRIDAIDIVLYRVAISFARSSDRIEKRHDEAVKRLQAIAAGKASLSFASEPGGEDAADPNRSANEVLMDAPSRVFDRRTTRDL
ncbi:hypothetical protein FP2506_11417 [Fulvimarina pelagi HTCC2506]|uniref:DUF1320 domain-containing protein n=1 Tax=Fulvimarina pelagi HTCC2506 TaxID=314231 RepID=Q0FYZ6_9HYPH|nr:phage protein Gp36 family protein [Fulvimarina pelagi]EAU40162.1 hypothetical protein FP2506_11417 [Fulvimarina pelagi HTCC2506]